MDILVWVWIVGLGILLIGCPFLGLALYRMKNVHAAIVYACVSLIITVINFLLTDHASPDIIQTRFLEYFTEFLHFRTVIIFSFITYLCAGFGIVGGILEFCGERAESAEVYRTYKKASPFKLYFYYFLYGYIFLFALYAFSQFLTIILGWTYRVNTEFFADFITIFLFYSFVPVTLGALLFTIKAFRFGIFSLEFYRSEFDPKVANLGNVRREARRIVGCFLGALIVFCSLFLFFLEYFPATSLASQVVLYGKAFFFLAATIETILFYLFKHRFVDQLKPLSKQYELKVGAGEKVFEEKPEEKKVSDADLKYDD